MNQGSASPDGPENCQADTVFQFWGNLASLRSQMQHKCVEMSLQITTGLAVGVFAVMFHELSNSANPAGFKSAFSFAPAKICLVIIVDLYTILQLLILANYLYHSFMANIIELYLAQLNLGRAKAIHTSLLHNLETPIPSQRKCANNLYRFQPLIIYFSAFIGILACLGFALWLFVPPIGFLLPSLLVIIPLSLFFVLYRMYRIHTMLAPLARTWTWDNIERWKAASQSAKAPLEGHGMTA